MAEITDDVDGTHPLAWSSGDDQQLEKAIRKQKANKYLRENADSLRLCLRNFLAIVEQKNPNEECIIKAVEALYNLDSHLIQWFSHIRGDLGSDDCGEFALRLVENAKLSPFPLEHTETLVFLIATLYSLISHSTDPSMGATFYRMLNLTVHTSTDFFNIKDERLSRAINSCDLEAQPKRKLDFVHAFERTFIKNAFMKMLTSLWDIRSVLPSDAHDEFDKKTSHLLASMTGIGLTKKELKNILPARVLATANPKDWVVFPEAEKAVAQFQSALKKIEPCGLNYFFKESEFSQNKPASFMFKLPSYLKQGARNPSSSTISTLLEWIQKLFSFLKKRSKPEVEMENMTSLKR